MCVCVHVYEKSKEAARTRLLRCADDMQAEDGPVNPYCDHFHERDQHARMCLRYNIQHAAATYSRGPFVQR